MKANTPTQPLENSSGRLPSPLHFSPEDYLSTEPGIYWFKNENGKILYVGKAKNLKLRLKSYSRIKDLLPKTKKLVREVRTTEYLTVPSELDALILEAEMIRLHQPQYNAILKDDKSPLYIILTKDDFPMLKAARRNTAGYSEARKVYGPYASALKAKYILRFLRKNFGWCDKPESGKPCFYYHIDQCPGACMGLIDKKSYQENLKQAEMVLKGKKRLILRDLKRQIEKSVEERNFETAHKLKQKYEALDLTSVRNKPQLDLTFLPNLESDLDAYRLKALVGLLAEYMPIPHSYSLERIEGYDISNTQGTLATASMVVLTRGRKDPNQYRHFRMRGKVVGDVPMIKEVIRRRLNHEEWQLPNLMIIDGGKGQVNGAKEVMKMNIPVIGLAKNPDRLVMPTQSGWEMVKLRPEHPATKLVTILRNEAHRFARRYHFKLREKKLTA